MPQMTINEAIGQALAEEMRRDPRVLMFGEGVATKRKDLLEEFGTLRVRNTPLAEGIIAGTAAGAAATGLRPVVDLLFAWGGKEGTHTLANVSASLLGGTSRPSLY